MLRSSFPLKGNLPCKKTKSFSLYLGPCAVVVRRLRTHMSVVPLKVDDEGYGEDSEPSVNMAGEAMWRYERALKRQDSNNARKEIDRSASAIQNLVIKAFEDCVSAISHRWRNSIMSLKRNETIECATSFVM